MFIVEIALFKSHNTQISTIFASKLTVFCSSFHKNIFLEFQSSISKFDQEKVISKSQAFQVLLNITGENIILSLETRKLGKLSLICKGFAVKIVL